MLFWVLRWVRMERTVCQYLLELLEQLTMAVLAAAAT